MRRTALVLAALSCVALILPTSLSAEPTSGVGVSSIAGRHGAVLLDYLAADAMTRAPVDASHGRQSRNKDSEAPSLLDYIPSVSAAVTFTGSLTGATSATLTTPWALPSGAYEITLSNGAKQVATFANGSTSVTWVVAQIASASAQVNVSYAQFLIDATATFQAAFNAVCTRTQGAADGAFNKGARLNIPAMVLTMAGTTTVTVPCGVLVEGAGWNEVAGHSGTWLHQTGNGASLFTFASTEARGSVFSNIGIYQDQPVPVAFTGTETSGSATITGVTFNGVSPTGSFHVAGPGVPATTTGTLSGTTVTLSTAVSYNGAAQSATFGAGTWTPTVYPPVFLATNTAGRVTLRNIMGAPVYDLARADLSGRFEMDGIYGHVLHSAVWEDRAYDTSHLVGPVHLWDFWSQNPLVLDWTNANADALVLAAVSGINIPDFFAFGYHSCLDLVNSPNTPGNFVAKAHVGLLYCDASKLGLWSPGPAIGSADYNRPEITIDSFYHGGEVPYATDQTRIAGSASIQVDALAGLDLTAPAFKSEVVATPVNLQNTGYNSSTKLGGNVVLRFGAFHATNYTALSAIVDAGSGSDDVALATRAVLQNADGTDKYTLIANNSGVPASMAYFSAPLKHPALNIINSNVTLAYTSDTEGAIVTSGGTSLSGNTFVLPVSPFDGQPFAQTAIKPITGMSMTTNPASGSTITDSNPVTSMSTGQTISYRFTNAGGLNTWIRTQ